MVLKRFTDRLLSAGTSAANAILHSNSPEEVEKIRQLESMGFPRESARSALNATENDFDRALELLLPNHGTQSADGPSHDNNMGRNVAAHNEEQMRRAKEESLKDSQVEEARQIRQAQKASMMNHMIAEKSNGISPTKKNVLENVEAAAKTLQKPIANKTPHRSAAVVNAGKSALSRSNSKCNDAKGKTTLDVTHPNIKIPDKLQNKSKEEQILRCADRLKSHVMAVDTLIQVLNSVRTSPESIKFRTIDRQNPNYVKHVLDKPGAEDLLLAMNYRLDTHKNELRLERQMIDNALLYLGISALENVRTSKEYKESKRWRAFHAEMKRVAQQGSSHSTTQKEGLTAQETELRLAFMSKSPKEPPVGQSALIRVYLGDESEQIEGGYVFRRFDGDDVLNDVMNWLGGCYGLELLDKLTSREWCLCDLNRYPMAPFDVVKHGNKTLQFLGLFPSGKLGVRLSDEAWTNGSEGIKFDGSARGLGAVSWSMLHS